ncbi:uncharacterized protein Z519_08491 [Cladophialophora bantiana CBS 173.52]|uniref:DUF7603 domain-containing protein n=1 Tax=Cladophialophora bantiana (strain ATCC 10958 / CBS 173.52 / CDC B-1940 / NIH 8579) TaxID=1442370 RepID=A0A0D2HBQ9_CLAB1|nr:uncharacterized protein Z519_08491 [Cladophialophora bantiana CBS 173.52]KIW90708.1 hypothetical protein Z519_08491 [Cladophialophora bantiana CBS 173.52]
MDDNNAQGFASAPPTPPPPPKEYPPLQRLPSLSNAISAALKPFSPTSPASPVRRKPLPSNVSPVVKSPEAQTIQNRVDSPSYRIQRKRVPSDVVGQTTPDTTSPTLNRRNTNDSNPTKTITDASLPRVVGGSVTGSPKRSHASKRSNGYSVDSVIVEEDMGLKPGSRPPPLRTDSTSSTKSLTVIDAKKPQTPGSKFTSFFSRKPAASPSTESSVTDISDRKSPLPSPYGPSPHASAHSSQGYPFPPVPRPPTSQPSQDSIDFDGSSYAQTLVNNDGNRISKLEAELRDISTELANSIKREMDLEDLVEQLQTEGPSVTRETDRTSDYFSDSGTSSIRPSTSEGNPKEEIQRIKRESEQLRAQLKVEMSRKWQNERSSRQALESHIQILEQKLSLSRRDNNESADISARVKELEVALEDARRRLMEERQIKENFEDLLTALRVDLEHHRNERDNLRDEVVPQLRSQIEGLETSLSESQKSDYDFTRMQQELQSLRDENAALQSARAMNMQFQSIAEEGEIVESPRTSMIPSRASGLQRSNTILNRSNSRAAPNRSNSLSRSNSVNRAAPESQQSLADQLKDVTEQRNALHSTVKYLLRRQEAQRRQFEKRLKLTEAERDRAASLHGPKKGGYEREVRTLRSEINLLRKRADDALEQKWQCEKGLSGLKMDLDRSKQETASLQTLLQARDESAPEVLSSSLEQALRQLEQQRDQARQQESLGSLKHEQELAAELEMSAQRSESLAAQVRKQMQANAALRDRLKTAVEKGEQNQQASAEQINELQTKLRKLEDVINVAQMQSETAVMKHEEEVRVLRASHNIQLMRTKSGRKTPGYLTPTPRSPMSPMFVNSKKSPRLNQTTSGPGMALQQALKTEYLENKVAELEKALSEAEKEMGEVVGRMNTAQMGVAELESERDEALRQTRRLEAAIAAEREKVQALLNDDFNYGGYNSDY